MSSLQYVVPSGHLGLHVPSPSHSWSSSQQIGPPAPSEQKVFPSSHLSKHKPLGQSPLYSWSGRQQTAVPNSFVQIKLRSSGHCPGGGGGGGGSGGSGGGAQTPAPHRSLVYVHPSGQQIGGKLGAILHTS